MLIKMHYLRKISSWLLPYSCILCKQASMQHQDLCQYCQQDLPLLTNACQCCALPLLTSQASLTCGFCLQYPPPFALTHALYLYQPPLTQLILELKFMHSLVNARVLGELLTEKIQTTWYTNKPLPQVIIPVPLHPARLKERGFNQALEIARPIANQLQIPLNLTCQRRKYTRAQATLAGAQRQKNIENAFNIFEDFSGQHIAVIDDVITTGYTIREFCRALKRQGAKTIDVWCCARTPTASR